MRHTPECDKLHPIGNGQQRIYEFPNGYGASCVRFKLPLAPDAFAILGRGNYGSYTRAEDEWEVAVLWHGRLVYDTPITSDVLGYVREGAELDALLDRIAALPRWRGEVNAVRRGLVRLWKRCCDYARALRAQKGDRRG